MKDSDVESELLEVFQIFDRDGNGQVSPAELRYIMTHDLESKLSNERIKEVFRNLDVEDVIKRADSNQDGQIEYEEFVHFVMMELRNTKVIKKKVPGIASGMKQSKGYPNKM